MRGNLVRLHLYMAAFLSPILLMIAVSGGLYLIGLKGEVNSAAVAASESASLNLNSESLEADVRQLLADEGISHDFEYLKINGSLLTTRPTSRTYLDIKVVDEGLSITRQEPDFIKQIVELHKGHGPLLFKDFQKFVAVALMFVLFTGLWLGLTAPALKVPSLIAGGAGLVVTLLLILFA